LNPIKKAATPGKQFKAGLIEWPHRGVKYNDRQGHIDRMQEIAANFTEG
jgi:hypothetical protein